MKYDASEEIETDLEFIAHSIDDHFNDVYEIMKNNSRVVYTCPKGWVFMDSNNISQVAYCRNWTWEVDFNTSKPCIRKYHLHTVVFFSTSLFQLSSVTKKTFLHFLMDLL